MAGRLSPRRHLGSAVLFKYSESLESISDITETLF
jgi:hypothetical protein